MEQPKDKNTDFPQPYGNCTVITFAELERLKARDAQLSRLEAAGVDNWDGYTEAASDAD